MADEHGTVHFANLGHILGGTMVLSSGISPSSAILYAIPDTTLQRYGPLVFQCGDSFVFFRDCMVEDVSIIHREGLETGVIWEITVLDRRWRWRHGKISGDYNTIRDYGESEADSKKTSQELATLLLTAMGEEGFDVSQMPSDVYPPACWDAVNPARELARLADLCGCVVCLGLDDLVRICKLGGGVGPSSSGSPIRYEKLPADILLRPEYVRVVGPPILVDSKLRLRAIGRETDGTYDHVDNLSYKPATWAWTSFMNCGSVAQDDRPEAVDTLFLYYQIAGVPGASGHPAYIATVEDTLGVQIADYMQFLPILPYRAAIVERRHFDRSGASSAQSNKKPMADVPTVSGKTWNYGYRWCSTGETVSNGRISSECWRLLHDRGIVIFNTPIVDGWLTQGQTFFPEQLYLACSFHIRPNLTDPHVRYESSRRLDVSELGVYGGGDRILFREDLQRVVKFNFSDEGVLQSTEDNKLDVDLLAEKYLDAAMLQYEAKPRYTLEYPGIWRFEPSGRIRQVYWQAGMQRPALTRYGDRAEFSSEEQSESSRRRRERVDQLLEKTQ